MFFTLCRKFSSSFCVPLSCSSAHPILIAWYMFMTSVLRFGFHSKIFISYIILTDRCVLFSVERLWTKMVDKYFLTVSHYLIKDQEQPNIKNVSSLSNCTPSR